MASANLITLNILKDSGPATWVLPRTSFVLIYSLHTVPPAVRSRLWQSAISSLFNGASVVWVIVWRSVTDWRRRWVGSQSCRGVPLQRLGKVTPSSSSSSYLSCSWATCWPVPVSRVQKPLQRSAIFLQPVTQHCFVTLGSLLQAILFTCCRPKFSE
jgi:hypothetical protein